MAACKKNDSLIKNLYFLISRIFEAKSMLCLEVMQVLIMCPLFYTLIDNSSMFEGKFL
jgi:hypothetical protein